MPPEQASLTLGFPPLTIGRTPLAFEQHRPREARQRERSGASIGSEQPSPLAQSAKAHPPRASLRAQDHSRGAPTANQPPIPKNHQPVEGSANSKAYPFSCKSVSPPFAGRYRPDEAVAGEVRSEHWKRTTSTSGAKRQSPSSQSFPASAGPLPRSPHRQPTTDSQKIIHPREAQQIVKSGTFCVDMRDRPLWRWLEMTDPIATPALSERDGVA